jgi:RecA-family ATPase
VNPASRVLYLALEDPEDRVHTRLTEFEAEFGDLPGPEAFQIDFWPGLNLDQRQMFDYLENRIREGNPEVVILDTYQKATPGLSSFDDAKQSRVLHGLVDLTRRLGITIIILDHVRKQQGKRSRKSISIDDIKGTGGKAQNADAIILQEAAGRE